MSFDNDDDDISDIDEDQSMTPSFLPTVFEEEDEEDQQQKQDDDDDDDDGSINKNIIKKNVVGKSTSRVVDNLITSSIEISIAHGMRIQYGN